MSNQNTSRKLTSTNGVQLFGKGKDGSSKALSIAYLENTIGISIHSELPDNLKSDRSRFDYKTGNAIYLKGKAAKILATILKKAVKSYRSGESIGSSSVNSAENLIEITDGEKFNMGNTIVLCIYNGIKPDKTCDTYEVFGFGIDRIIGNYDCATGSYDDNELIDVDIEYFIDILTEFYKNSTGAAAHFIKKEFSYDIGRFVTRQLQMCQALGIQIENQYNSRGMNNYQNTNYQSPRPTSTASTSELLNEIDSLG